MVRTGVGFARIAVAMTLLLGLFVAWPAAPQAHATTCYGGASWFYFGVSPVTLTGPSNTALTTTNRCFDINMRKSTTVKGSMWACVIFVDHTNECNYYTEITTSWQTIATDVLDNTHFKVEVIWDWVAQYDPPYASIQLAY